MALSDLHFRNAVRVCVSFAFLLILAAIDQPSRCGAGNLLQKKKIAFQVRLSHDNVHAGSVFYAMLVVTIQDGWHINSAAPLEENLIPTTVDIGKRNVVDSVDIRFPKSTERMFEFSETPLDVYEGTVNVLVRLRMSTEVKPGTYTITASVGYQACSNKVCLAPATEKSDVSLHVVSEKEKVSRINRELFERFEEVPKE